MSVTYGFFNAQLVDGVYDRAYNAYQMSSLFQGIIEDGVFENIGNHLQVLATNPASLAVNVNTGKCWFNNHWLENDSLAPLTLSTAHVLYSRIDSVCVCVNDEDSVRTVSLVVVAGTPSTTPVQPTLTDTTYVHYHRLANVTVAANATEITQAEITNKIGTTETPFITGPLETVDAGVFTAQWDAQVQQLLANASSDFNGFLTTSSSTFSTWFQNLQNQLDDNQAAHLQNQINQLQNVKQLKEVTLPVADWVNSSGVYSQTVSVSGITATDEPMLVSVNDDITDTTYNKNYAIISAGVHTTGAGTCTFNVTKLPSADITVGLKGV